MASRCRELDVVVVGRLLIRFDGVRFCSRVPRSVHVHRHDIWRAFRGGGGGAENCGDAKAVKVPSIHRLNAIRRARSSAGLDPGGLAGGREGATTTTTWRGYAGFSWFPAAGVVGTRPVSRGGGITGKTAAAAADGCRIRALNLFCS